MELKRERARNGEVVGFQSALLAREVRSQLTHNPATLLRSGNKKIPPDERRRGFVSGVDINVNVGCRERRGDENPEREEERATAHHVCSHLVRGKQ
jgi:hypothetical protein